MVRHSRTSLRNNINNSTNNREESDISGHRHDVVILEGDVNFPIWADQFSDPDEGAIADVTCAPSHTATLSSSSFENDDIEMVLELDTPNQHDDNSECNGSNCALPVHICDNDDDPTPQYFENQAINL